LKGTGWVFLIIYYIVVLAVIGYLPIASNSFALIASLTLLAAPVLVILYGMFTSPKKPMVAPARTPVQPPPPPPPPGTAPTMQPTVEKRTGGRDVETSEAVRNVRQQAENYRRALKYLDGCGDLTYEKLREVWRISGVNMSESQLRQQWSQAHYILPTGGQPGGKEYLRLMMRKTLTEAIATFETLADKLARSGK
jgi:hypothetical protein